MVNTLILAVLNYKLIVLNGILKILRHDPHNVIDSVWSDLVTFSSVAGRVFKNRSIVIGKQTLLYSLLQQKFVDYNRFG